MEFAADVLVSAVGVAVIALYIWSTRGHFVSERMPLGAKLISAVVIVSAGTFLYLTWAVVQPLWAQLAGVLLQLMSTALFFATITASRQARLRFAFDPAPPHGLVRSGPYRFVRHPFYASYLVFWIGWALAVWSAWAVVNLAVLAILYVVAARSEERRFAGTALAGEYEAYRAQAGLFWPRIPRPHAR
jgi:protein-S-isoprenylcysteine O-methyltransferase Ste14